MVLWCCGVVVATIVGYRGSRSGGGCDGVRCRDGVDGGRAWFVWFGDIMSVGQNDSGKTVGSYGC